jgi:hypothetical protein
MWRLSKGTSTLKLPSLCFPWNRHGQTLPSLFFSKSTTGFITNGTAAEARIALKITQLGAVMKFRSVVGE